LQHHLSLSAIFIFTYSSQIFSIMEPFLGQIMAVGFNYAPRGWAFCQGQLMSIAQNTALFSLLGTQYGGDGVTTFALPDYRGRVAVGMGQGPGLSNYEQAEVSGTENVTLLQSQMPAHVHPLQVSAQVQVSTTNPTADEPAGAFLTTTGNSFYASKR
jgi:microcystin-dependent protein